MRDGVTYCEYHATVASCCSLLDERGVPSADHGDTECVESAICSEWGYGDETLIDGEGSGPGGTGG